MAEVKFQFSGTFCYLIVCINQTYFMFLEFVLSIRQEPLKIHVEHGIVSIKIKLYRISHIPRQARNCNGSSFISTFFKLCNSFQSFSIFCRSFLKTYQFYLIGLRGRCIIIRRCYLITVFIHSPFKIDKAHLDIGQTGTTAHKLRDRRCTGLIRVSTCILKNCSAI